MEQTDAQSRAQRIKGIEMSFEVPASPNKANKLLHNLLHTRSAVFGLLIIILVVIMAATASWIAPYDPEEVILTDRLIPPIWSQVGSADHILGTDSLGRDTLSRLVYGSRVSVLVGLTAVSISSLFGILMGLFSGYYGGWVDDVIMRIGDIQLAFPFILLAISILAVLGSGLLNIIVVLGITGWVTYARITRGQVISIKEQEYILAARSVGISNVRIIFRHIFPNLLAPIIVIVSFDVAAVIISEASLSFLGLGVPPSIPTWGSMLADGRDYIYEAWWMAVFPGVAIMLTVLGINMIGDWMRDYFDPRSKQIDLR